MQKHLVFDTFFWYVTKFFGFGALPSFSGKLPSFAGKLRLANCEVALYNVNVFPHAIMLLVPCGSIA